MSYSAVPVKLGRQLTLAGVDQSLRIVQEGLKADQRVIVNGIQRARQGVKVAAKQVELPRPQTAAPTPPAEQKQATAPAPFPAEKPAAPTQSAAKESDSSNAVRRAAGSCSRRRACQAGVSGGAEAAGNRSPSSPDA